MPRHHYTGTHSRLVYVPTQIVCERVSERDLGEGDQ